MMANRILEGALARVRQAQQGDRNNVLNREAFLLAHRTQPNNSERNAMSSELLQAALYAGLSKEEAESTIKSGLAAGLKKGGSSPPRHNASSVNAPLPSIVSPISEIAFTWWESKEKPEGGDFQSWSWEKFQAMVERPPEVQSSDPDIKKNLPVLSPARFKGNYRNAANVVEVYCLSFDVDDGLVPIDTLDLILHGLSFFAHSTFSHSPDKPKWRCFIPLSRPVSASEYGVIWRLLSVRFPGVDASAKDASRAFYVPCRRPGHEYLKLTNRSDLFLDVDALLARADDEPGALSVEMFQSLDELSEGDWLASAPPPRRALLKVNTDGTEEAKDFLLLGKTAMLAGAGGVAKTAAICGLAMSVATGRPWMKMFTVDEPGDVLLVLGEEDGDEIKRRMQGISLSLQLTNQERRLAYKHIHVLPAYAADVRMVDPIGGHTSAFQMLQAYLGEFSKEWKLVVLDPASRFMSGTAEIDAAAATRYVECLESLTQVPGEPCVLTTHHVSKGAMRSSDKDQGAPRGSSALVDGIRWLTVVERPRLKPDEALRGAGVAPETLVMMTMQKSNYTPLLNRPLYFRVSRGGVLKPLSAQQSQAVHQVLSPGCSGNSGRKGRAASPSSSTFEGLA